MTTFRYNDPFLISNSMNASHYLIDFDPVFLSLGPISIHWYGVTYLIGFAFYWLLGTWMINNRKTSWDKDQLSDFMFYGALGVIIGGRLGWIAFYNDTSLISDPLLPFRVWEGGMSFHGGLIGVITAMFYFSHKTKRHFLATADFIAPLAPLGILSVRMGNFINGELWGRLSQHPWAMIFPDSLPVHLHESSFVSKALWLAAHEAGQFTTYARHPSPLYEALGEGLLAFFFVWAAVFLAKKRLFCRLTMLTTMIKIITNIVRVSWSFIKIWIIGTRRSPTIIFWVIHPHSNHRISTKSVV